MPSDRINNAESRRLNAALWHFTWPQLLALALLASFVAGAWQGIDEAVFRYLDARVASSTDWAWWVAVTNQRRFDFLIGAVMGTVLAVEFFRRRGVGRAKLLVMVPIMGATFSLLVVMGEALPVEARLSPTLVHESAARVTGMYPDIRTKDSSPNAFPSDHGIGVLTFLLFAYRAFPGPHLWVSVPLLLLMLTPRFLAGAHWASDLFCGSLPLVLMAWAWLFQTRWLERLLDAGLATASRWLQRLGLLGEATPSDPQPGAG